MISGLQLKLMVHEALNLYRVPCFGLGVLLEIDPLKRWVDIKSVMQGLGN